MKKLGYLLLLISGICNAQIVNIPDANFKNRLINTSCVDSDSDGNYDSDADINNDGEIQLSEALLVTNLNVSNSAISDLTGIEAFVNLWLLNCKTNNINAINLNSLASLDILECDNNPISIIDLSLIPNLTFLGCGSTQVTNLDFINNPNLNLLRATYCNQLTSLNLSGHQDCILDVEGLTSLEYLNVNGCTNLQSNIPLVDFIANNINLITLDMGGVLTLTFLVTFVPNVNISGCINLEFLVLNNSNINDFSEFVNLELLDVTNCNLTTINLTGLNSLKTFRCMDNQITDLNLSGLHNLEEINCIGNLLTSLDLYGLTNLVSLNCSNNLLTNLNIKNGAIEEVILDGNPNLEFICADELQIPTILQQYPNLNGHISSYCTFTPGGNYNTIIGNVNYDFNNDGCDANDSVKPNIRMNITSNSNTSDASFTNNAGNYAFFTQAGTFTLTPDIENPSWYNFSPNTADVVFADNNNNIMLQNFCIVPNGVHPDIEVVISPITPARPGFDAVYQITYKNKGNYTYTDGFVNLEYDDTVLDFVSTSQSPNSQGLGSIGWIFSNLLPFESRSIQVTFNVNAPTETPAVNIGDVLTFRVYSYPSEVDETPLDNDFTYNQTVVGSYDPNDISCLEGNSLPPSEIGNYLHYAINFENTGNYPAENIVVKTEVDATKFDINSLQLLATSNPVDARITGNKVEFIFQNIQLPIGGHGHILLKVKSKSSLVTGDSVAKRADIFFDYNAPIDTGFANTTFQTLSNTIFETDSTINVYPNPTTSKITINSDFDLKSIQVYDVQGRILETLIGNSKILDISNKANGVYFLKITTNKGSKIEKLIKK